MVRHREQVEGTEAGHRVAEPGETFASFGLPTANASLSRAQDIVVELMSTLDARHAPDLVEKLGDVYQFVAFRLLSARTNQDAKAAREAERVFTPIAEAFAEVVAQLPNAAASGAGR